jgi:hypothetical protein
MKKSLIPLGIIVLLVIGFALVRNQQLTPSEAPPVVSPNPPPSPLGPPVPVVDPPQQVSIPTPPDPMPPKTPSVPTKVDQPPTPPTPPEDPDSLIRESVPAPPGELDMAALFKQKMLDQVRAQTAAQQKIHYADFEGNDERLAELLLQRRLAMVEAGIAAQMSGQQPDPAAIAGAYSAAEGDIQKHLGGQYQDFVDFEMGIQDRIEVDSIIGVFTSDEVPISEIQQDQLLALMQEERAAAGLAYRWDSPDVMSLFQGNIPEMLTKHHEMYKAINGRVGEVFEQRQADVLRNFFEHRLENMMNTLNALPRQARGNK